MNKVISINLAGRSYAIEEAGFNALRTYLDEAAKNLEGNPDKEEILKDFDVAVSEKCENYLTAQKNVISAQEVEQIIKDMGPVESTGEKSDTASENTTRENSSNNQNEKEIPKQKRLFQIREGAWITGVCNGLAVYFDVDVMLVRIIFIILTVLTHGLGILIYLILMFVLPHANTPEDRAQAFGTSKMTAQDLLNNAKTGYQNFKNSKEWRRWKHQMKEEAKQWKKRWKYEQRAQQYNYRPSPLYEIVQSLIGMIWVVLIFAGLWFAYNHIGPVHQLFDLIGLAWMRLIQALANKIGV